MGQNGTSWDETGSRDCGTGQGRKLKNKRDGTVPSLLHPWNRGVYKHVAEEMKKSDWSLLIGHMLGVDHCGHTYGQSYEKKFNFEYLN